MSWDDDGDVEYANGADGACQDCGADTDQPWHLYCADCWEGPDDDDEQESERRLELVEFQRELDNAFDRERDDALGIPTLLERCPGCGDRRVMFPSPLGRRCLDCVTAARRGAA